jgi:hypothetical protein
LDFEDPRGPVVQRSERAAHNGVVAGSNPAGPTRIYKELAETSISSQLMVSAD